MRDTVNIRRTNDEGEEYEVEVEVEFEVEATEYEGTYLFSQGGIYIDRAWIDGREVNLDPYEENAAIDRLKGRYEVPVEHYPLS